MRMARHVGRMVGMRRACAALALCVATAGGAAHAAGYRSVGAEPAILYNAPTERARKVFIAPQGMPVEVILEQDGWSKIRDASTDLSWVESRLLVARRMVVVTADHAVMRMAPSDTAPVAGTAEKGVLFELAAPANAGWVKVRHADGSGGYLKAGDVWGD